MGLFDIFKKKESSTPQDLSIGFSFGPPFIPVEERIKTAIADRYGLYPHEILALDYAHTYYTDKNEYQGFWLNRYGVSDVKAVLTSLLKRGFIQVGGLRDVLNEQTAASIKELLKAFNKKTTGKKTELVQRAVDEIPEKELNARFPRRTYSLTETGQAALNENAYISYIHRNEIEDLDIWLLNRLVNTPPVAPYLNKIWGYLNQRSAKHLSDKNFGLYIGCRYKMAQLLMENTRPKDALLLFTEAIFYTLCGAGNGYNPEFLEIHAKHFFPYESSHVRLLSGSTNEIVECQKALQYSDEELKSVLIEHMSKLRAPVQLFTVDECAQIIMLERDQKVDELEKIYDRAKNAFKRNYPNVKI